MPTINQDLFDKIVRFQIDLRRFESGSRKRIIKILLKAQKEIVAELADGTLSELGKQRISRLLNNINIILTSYYSDAQKSLQEDLNGIADVQLKQAKKALESTVFVDINAELPTTKVMESLASNVMFEGVAVKDWWAKQSQDTMFKIGGAIRQGIVMGETNQEIIYRIIGKRGVPGVLEISRRNAAAIVQTSIQAVANDARNAVYAENGDVVKNLVHLSTMDSHTTKICIARSGLKWTNTPEHKPIGHNIPFQSPPLHWSCRSVLYPETLTFKEMGIDLPEPPVSTRASSLGQISADTTFDDYLKMVPKEQVEEMLGKGRAELYFNKIVTLQQLLDGSGRELSLEELKAKYL